MSKAIVFGNMNLNLIDGSAIWLVSLAETLSGVFDEVHLPLAVEITDDRLVRRLFEIDNIVIHRPADSALSGTAAEIRQRFPERIEQLQTEIRAEAIIARGTETCARLSAMPGIAERLWSYVTDFDFPISTMTEARHQQLEQIISDSRGFFAQTEASRAFLETVVPVAAGKTDLMPPTVLDESFAPFHQPPVRDDTRLRLIYSGKFAKDWRTLEMLDVPARLRALGIDAELRVLGDKFQSDPVDNTWVKRMRARLNEVAHDPHSGVTWLGGVSREESLAEIAAADIGLCWRTRTLDSNLELSTKVLEYSASGTPPVINRTADNVRMFGDGYPLFVSGDDDADSLADSIVSWHGDLGQARDLAHAAVQPHAMSAVREHYRRVFSRAGVLVKQALAAPDKRLVMMGAPTSQARLLRGQLQVRNDLEVALAPESSSPDVLVHFGLAGTPLIEAERRVLVLSHDEVAQMNEIPGCDAIVVESNSDAESLRALTRGDAVDIAVIPPFADHVDLDRPKDALSRFHLGMSAADFSGESGKRAMALMNELIQQDDRYLLHIRGPVSASRVLAGIRPQSMLGAHLRFDAGVADTANWLRQVGIVLSPAIDCPFDSLAAQALASGACVIAWERPGAAAQLGDVVVDSVAEAATRVLELRESAEFERSSAASVTAAANWDVPTLMARWASVLNL